MLTRNNEIRKIAAKIVDRRRAPGDFVNKFLPRELEMYRKLNHPNIVKIYDVLEIYTRIYVFMDLAERGDLLDLIKVKSI